MQIIEAFYPILTQRILLWKKSQKPTAQKEILLVSNILQGHTQFDWGWETEFQLTKWPYYSSQINLS